VIKLLLITTFLLLFAYPAFSYDVFNYIFDARILVHYHLNPWQHTALDFPADTWTRFMHWTHRTYPYGPTWIFLTIPFYLLGSGKFVLTLLSFKLLALLSYFVCVWVLWRLVDKSYRMKAVILFAFNPLVIIEGLVSAHLDMAMAGLMMAGLYFWLNRKQAASVLLFLISAGIKYVSASLIPSGLLLLAGKINQKQFLYWSTATSYLLTFWVIINREILPWYFLVPFALTCLQPQVKHLQALMIIISAATLVRYYPYLQSGDYSPWVIQTRDLLTVLITAGGIIIYFLMQVINKYPRFRKH
jgi:hypothetical protein